MKFLNLALGLATLATSSIAMSYPQLNSVSGNFVGGRYQAIIFGGEDQTATCSLSIEQTSMSTANVNIRVQIPGLFNDSKHYFENARIRSGTNNEQVAVVIAGDNGKSSFELEYSEQGSLPDKLIVNRNGVSIDGMRGRSETISSIVECERFSAQ